MTIRTRMILMNQFNNLIKELETASEELEKAIKLNKQDNLDLKYINADIIIARQRVKEFKNKTVKEFEKLNN